MLLYEISNVWHFLIDFRWEIFQKIFMKYALVRFSPAIFILIIFKNIDSRQSFSNWRSTCCICNNFFFIQVKWEKNFKSFFLQMIRLDQLSLPPPPPPPLRSLIMMMIIINFHMELEFNRWFRVSSCCCFDYDDDDDGSIFFHLK